jgi:polyhydroxyalkanoate synthesis regulator phasin
MDQKQLFKQMLDFQKATFDNSFKAMANLQEQGEKMVDTFLQQATWLPEEGKKAVANWINAYQEGRAKYREAVDQNFEKVEAYFAGTDKSAE